MRHRIIAAVFAATISLAFCPPAFSQESPLDKYLAVPGAKVTLAVAAAKKPFSKDFVKTAHDSFNSFHAQMGGDHTLYYLLNFSAVMRTDMSMPNAE